MPSITITDLQNAKRDVDHIGAIATSPAGTATDRLGTVKNTIAGSLALIGTKVAAVETARIAGQSLIDADVAAVDTRKAQALAVDIPAILTGLAAFNPRGAWATGTAYALKDVYIASSIAYVVTLAHTSTTVAADLAAGRVAVHQGATREELAASSGAGLVGYDSGTTQTVLDDAKSMQSYAALRTYTGRATGIRLTTIGIAGFFNRDAADTTSPDNAGTVIIDAAGRRWKRAYYGDVHARWFGIDGAAIQAAIIAAKVTKSVIIGPGTWDVSTPIIFPSTSDYWGMSVRGAKPSHMYQQLGTSASTTLRATAAITVVIGNRPTWGGDSGYYNSVSNLTINGNSLANYGYINGYQDTLTDAQVTGCVTAGIINGSLTNSTKLINVSSTSNLRHGLILTGGSTASGKTSTGTILTNCRIRENGSRGVVICQTYGTKFDNCIIESNVGEGVAVDFATSGEEYRSPNPFTGLVTFTNSYWENNQSIFSAGSSGSVITDFIFDRCSFQGKNSGTDIYLRNFIGAKFKHCVYTNIGGLYMDASSSYVEIEAFATDALPPILGPLATNVGIKRLIADGGTSHSKNQYIQACGFRYVKNVTAVLTRDEVCGSIIDNSGQAAVDVVLTVPGAALNIAINSKSVTTNFTFLASSQQIANRFEFSAEAGTYFMFKGAQRTKIFTTALAYGMALKFTFIVIQGSPYWLVDEVFGAWSSS